MPILWFRSLPTVENRGLHLFNRNVIRFLKNRENARKIKKTRGNLGFSPVHLFWHRYLVAGEGLEPTTFGLWARRATNCSTPRRILILLRLSLKRAFILYHHVFLCQHKNALFTSFFKNFSTESLSFFPFSTTFQISTSPYNFLSKSAKTTELTVHTKYIKICTYLKNVTGVDNNVKKQIK